MNLEIVIDELSLPHGSNAADFDHQIATAIHGHLNQDASKLFNTSNALETIGVHVANATDNQGLGSFASGRSSRSILD